MLLGHALSLAAPLPAAVEAPARLVAVAFGALSLAACFSGSAAWSRVLGLSTCGRLEAVFGAAALIAAGACLGSEADRAAWPLPTHPRPVRVLVEGRVLDTTAADAEHASLVFEVRSARVGEERAGCRASVLLRWGEGGLPPRWALPGLSLRLAGDYRPPEDARNPGVAAPGRWLERAGLSGTIDADPATVSVLADRPEEGVLWGGLIRHRLARVLSRDLSAPVAALARGMALGDRSGISPTVRDSFRAGGTIHILSISGLHVCVLAGIAALVAVALRLGAVPGLILELACLWGYVLLVGAPASAVRSAILWTAVRGGRLSGRAVRPLTGWGLAGLFLHLLDPDLLSDPGFQLSFVAVLGLAASGALRVGAPGVETGPVVVRKLRGWFVGGLGLLVQSLCAEAGTLAVQIRHFGAIPIAGLLLNVAVIPLCGLFMSLLLLYLGCAFLFPPLAPIVAGSVDASGLLMLILTARTASHIPPVAARAAPSLFAIAVGLGALLVAAASSEGSRAAPGSARSVARWVALAALLVAWACPFLARDARPYAGAAPWLLALDVGQGDATIVCVPGRASLLVDAGPSTASRDEGRYAVEPVLRAEGIARLDVAILSHAHRDHYGGFAWLLDRGWIRRLYENGSDPDGAWRLPLVGRGAVGSAGGSACLAPLRADTTLVWCDGASLRVFAAGRGLPAATTANTEENNRSLVAAVRLGGAEVCFAGDVEADAEEALLASLPPAQILKVPHHGSKTSSEAAWIEALAPRIAIISCGERNHFGHPDPATVGRYLKRGVRVFRTDLEGAIRITPVMGGAYVSTRAHPAPELIPWSHVESVSPSGHSP